jgi:hypothetical protein
LQIPTLNPYDLVLLLAFGSVILLITSELASENYGLANLAVDKRRLQKAAITIGLLFLTFYVGNIISNIMA